MNSLINTMEDSTRKSGEIYKNLVQSDKELFAAGSINEIEMNTMNCEDTENPEENIYRVKKISNPKLKINTERFKMKHCRKVRSILRDGVKYNSIYHPKDDIHAFYILRDKKGNFYTRENTKTRKREMLQHEIENFNSKINSIVNIEEVAIELKSNLKIKILIYVMMGISILLLSYNILFVFMYLISIMVGNLISNQDIPESNSIESEKIINFILTFVCISLIWVFYKMIAVNKAKDKIILFEHIYTKKRELEIELEYWNTCVFGPHNMKAFLSDTLDYVGVFYDRDIVYEIDEHF